MGLVYFLRLQEANRAALNENIKAITGGGSVADTIAAETQLYINNVRLDEGIAENKALKENVFAIIVCIQLRMPLIIVGPPGSSKTLSFQIVQQNVLNDANVRENIRVHGGIDNPSFFTGFLSVEAGVFHYQCSEHSTSNEVKTVFERAIQRQSGWESNHSAAKGSDSFQSGLKRTAVVFMDEAGLPEDAKESLKVLHYYLDDPAVGFVAITNRPLDAAKMNRAVVLFRPAADKQELGLLLAGSLGGRPDQAHHATVCAFRDAYHGLMSSTAPILPGSSIVFERRYGLRDFYNFGRYFARRCQTPQTPSDLELLHSLERNFNGVSRPEFEAIAAAFYTELERVASDDEAAAERGLARLRALRPRSVVDVLREALADNTADAKRMNETIVRYTLVLDETEDDSAARLLFHCGILDRSKTVVYDLSDFPADRNDVVRSTLISNIKHAMNKGTTVFLMHTAPIHGSLYDLLNQHFTRMEKRDEVVYYANVAVGSFSRPCQVHPNFRLIVHLPTWQQAPAPFYNRFEKYLITVTNLWEDLVNDARLKDSERTVLRQVSGWRGCIWSVGMVS